MASPTMLQKIVDEQVVNPRDISSLRLIAYGSTSAPPRLVADAKCILGCALQQWYGSTEMVGMASILRDEDHQKALVDSSEILKSCGKAILGTEIQIRDARGRVAPTGEPGDVHVRSTAMFSGYHNLPHATKSAMAGGWFKPGDIGKMDSNGYLYVLDRAGFEVRTQSTMVFTTEMERLLASHISIKEVAVAPTHESVSKPAIGLFVVFSSDVETHAASVLELARTHVSDKGINLDLYPLLELPRGATGKVNKLRLREQALDRTLPVYSLMEQK